jgi:PASTA domain
VPDVVKGGLFVGAAVTMGMLAGLLLPNFIGDERETAKRPRAQKSLPPTMPSVIGQPLDEAEGELRRRGISYVADAPDIFEATVPDFLEVCGSEPNPGRPVRGSAHLRTALAGTCHI